MNQAQNNHIIISSQHPAAQTFTKHWIKKVQFENEGKNGWSSMLPPNYTHIVLPYLPKNLEMRVFWVEIKQTGSIKINFKDVKL